MNPFNVQYPIVFEKRKIPGDEKHMLKKSTGLPTQKLLNLGNPCNEAPDKQFLC